MCLGTLIAVMQYALRKSAEKKELKEREEKAAAAAADTAKEVAE